MRQVVELVDWNFDNSHKNINILHRQSIVVFPTTSGRECITSEPSPVQTHIRPEGIEETTHGTTGFAFGDPACHEIRPWINLEPTYEARPICVG